MSTAAIVLCGGKSTRMGRDKAWLPWSGVPMISHVVATLRPLVDEVIVVSSKDLALPAVDARVVRDRQPALGPLSGIREGLACTRSELAFVTATDAPYLSAAFVNAMLGHKGAAATEVDGHVQTLAAVYPRSSLPVVEAMLHAKRLRPLGLLEELGYTKLPADELPNIESVQGFNTPAEYLDAVRRTVEQPMATLELFGRARMEMGTREIAVPIGTLGEVLGNLLPNVEILDGDSVAKHYLVSLDGLDFVRNTAIPVGAGERVIVLDGAVGG
jgi:molybdopterin-guanine dinucleotide biosynthesis protein A